MLYNNENIFIFPLPYNSYYVFFFYIALNNYIYRKHNVLLTVTYARVYYNIYYPYRYNYSSHCTATEFNYREWIIKCVHLLLKNEINNVY